MKWKIDKPKNKYHNKNLSLLKLKDLDLVPDGTILISILGEEVVKGKDYIDRDTRGGYSAFGFLI